MCYYRFTLSSLSRAIYHLFAANTVTLQATTMRGATMTIPYHILIPKFEDSIPFVLDRIHCSWICSFGWIGYECGGSDTVCGGSDTCFESCLQICSTMVVLLTFVVFKKIKKLNVVTQRSIYNTN